MQVYQQFDVNMVPPACSLIKNETPAQVFFLRILRNVSAGNYIKNNNPAQVFSSEFWKVFKNTCFGEHLRKAASSIARFFVRLIVH